MLSKIMWYDFQKLYNPRVKHIMADYEVFGDVVYLNNELRKYSNNLFFNFVVILNK